MPYISRMLSRRTLLLAGAISVSSVTSVVKAAAQQPVPPQQATPQQPATPPVRRKALEIHGQAPAPEVVTVRPREIPQYTRKVLTPVLSAGTKPNKSTTVVVLNAPLPELRAQPNQSQKPE